MTTIDIVKIIGCDSLWLTQAGALALATPCGMKDYISNNRRGQDGREYLTPHVDDTTISVQFCCSDYSAGISEFQGLFTNGKATITFGKTGNTNSATVLYKNVGSASMQGGAIVFSANLIKLASSSTEEGGND